jgi:hypothetical protein
VGMNLHLFLRPLQLRSERLLLPGYLGDRDATATFLRAAMVVDANPFTLLLRLCSVV